MPFGAQRKDGPFSRSRQVVFALRGGPAGRQAGVPAEMHVFKDGPHGTGLGMLDPALAEWPRLLANWLKASGFLKSR